MKKKYLIIILILSSIFSYSQNRKVKKVNNSEMNLNENLEIKKILEKLKNGMISFMEYSETEYSKLDVEKCMLLIHNFLNDISKSDSKESGMLTVKKIVLELNELNEKCGYELIETSQREKIAEIIILSGHLKGYNGKNEDITEKWREW